MLARRRMTVDLLITLVLLGLFIWVVFQARAWPFRASLFPMMTTAFALFFLLLKLVRDFTTAAAPIAEPTPKEDLAKEKLLEEEVAEEAELEDIFETAPRATWFSALAWMGLFFVLLWLLGMYVTVPVFALLYLLFVSRERWWAAVAYAVVSWAVVYYLFDQFLHVPLPTSTLLGLLAT